MREKSNDSKSEKLKYSLTAILQISKFPKQKLTWNKEKKEKLTYQIYLNLYLLK